MGGWKEGRKEEEDKTLSLQPSFLLSISHRRHRVVHPLAQRSRHRGVGRVAAGVEGCRADVGAAAVVGGDGAASRRNRAQRASIVFRDPHRRRQASFRREGGVADGAADAGGAGAGGEGGQEAEGGDGRG